MTPVRKLRCAVYTRKSSDEGLDMAFNSLDAQRDAGEAYVASQRSEGWVLVPDRYDDGGISGGTLERPALKRLLKDVEAGLIDVVVVYKVDRLSRSLVDFGRLMELFEQHQASFVSVTQQFSTTTSMGRLTLNMLLSFAQFEREVGGERIRDKIAASKRRGMFMGGYVPMGYRVKDRNLHIVEDEATVVRRIFSRFAQTRSAIGVVQELKQDGCLTPARVSGTGKRYGGRPFTKGDIYKILHQRLYIGEISHRGEHHPGRHEAIIERNIWDRVQGILASNPRQRAATSRAKTPALLKGLIFGPEGTAMTPSHTRKKGKLYRYYVSMTALKQGYDSCPIRSVPAGAVEQAVLKELHRILASPEMIVATWQAANTDGDISETEVRGALLQLHDLWNELFPAEQARIVQLLVDRVIIDTEGLTLNLNVAGIDSITRQLQHGTARQEAA
jgi:DNA invertase Pin-like site-specific DNA recombinase